MKASGATAGNAAVAPATEASPDADATGVAAAQHWRAPIVTRHVADDVVDRLVTAVALGLYVTRNRQWIQMTAEDQTASSQVRIDSPQRLRFYPDINAVLGGQSIDENLASGSAARPMNLMGDDMVLPKACNKTVGVGWQINSVTSLDVDFVHDYAFDQFGTTDRNLPPTGRSALRTRVRRRGSPT